MKQIHKLCLLLLLVAATCGIAQGQTLTEEQKKIFQERIKQKVELFQDEMKTLSNNQLTTTNRASAVYDLLALFIGKGDPYTYDEYVNGTLKTMKNGGVKIEVSSVNTGRKSKKKLKEYIYEFFNPETKRSSKPYQRIVVEYCDAVRVDNLQRVGDHYECMAYFTQRFYGYRDGRVVYSDETTKKIKCRIDHKQLANGHHIWDAKLGDIYVVSTGKI